MKDLLVALALALLAIYCFENQDGATNTGTAAKPANPLEDSFDIQRKHRQVDGPAQRHLSRTIQC